MLGAAATTIVLSAGMAAAEFSEPKSLSGAGALAAREVVTVRSPYEPESARVVEA